VQLSLWVGPASREEPPTIPLEGAIAKGNTLYNLECLHNLKYIKTVDTDTEISDFVWGLKYLEFVLLYPPFNG
jgi:hypothetical protein